MIKNLLGNIVLGLGLISLALYFFAPNIAKDVLTNLKNFVPAVLFLYLMLGVIWSFIPDIPSDFDT